MSKYLREIENLKQNIIYGNCITNDDLADEKTNSTVEITQELFEQAQFLLFFKQDESQRVKSRKHIDKLREDIKKGNIDLPAIAITKFPTYNFIVDGNHRVVALYREGIKTYESVYIKVRDEQ